LIAAKKGPEAAPEYDEEVTVERRVKLPPEAMAYASQLTIRMTKIDSRLLAIARGELDPEDPFGGLIPIYENDDTKQIDDAWLTIDPPPESEPGEGLFGKIVPRVRKELHELLELPIDARSRFFASQIDGRRNVEELVDACAVNELEALEIIDELLRLGAIELA
jgi:hypothetical protein